MAKNLKKGLSMALAALMCAGTMSTAVMAAEGTIWKAGGVNLSVKPGDGAYTYVIGQDVSTNNYYYETSNHTVKKEVTGGGAVHIFPVFDSNNNNGAWKPDPFYKSGVSNYDVVYCCDAVTATAENVYYKRVNLEDSEYVSAADAERLRAILTNAYPYRSVEEVKAALKEAKFAQADQLDRSELIAATQAAIWTIANPDSGDSYRYNKTATTAQKLTWGGYMHEFASEITNFTDSKDSRKYLSNPNGVGTRVNALIDFYLAMPGIKANEGQIVISKLAISKYDENSSGNTVTLKVALNQGADADDEIELNAYVDGKLAGEPVQVGTATEYTLTVNAKATDSIQVVVSGTQKLERGVYFYAPQPQDVNGDGIATSREVSQNLISVAVGDTPIYAEATVEFGDVEFDSGDVSNISYMFINEKTGEVDFLKKIDVAEGTVSVPVITMDGYVSAIFMKQATSGMFWFSEEVDENTVNATIDCLKANNPSYKGHNAVCFGEGDHKLEFKKNKFVTYTFHAGSDESGNLVIGGAENNSENSESSVESETGKNNGNGKNKNKNKK